jgi:hypothetical protein
MKCEDAVKALQPSDEGHLGDRAEAEAHVFACEMCRDALYAVEILKAQEAISVPTPDPLLFARVMRTAAQQARVGPQAGRRGFWLGAVVGGLLAAALVLAIVVLRGAEVPAVSSALPEIRLAVNETRNVSIALDSPRVLEHAEVRVLLSGAIGLAGFDGQRDLRWYTDLDAGVNKLTLPIVAFGADGGQLVVEVKHDDQRRTFVVNVRSV